MTGPSKETRDVLERVRLPLLAFIGGLVVACLLAPYEFIRIGEVTIVKANRWTGTLEACNPLPGCFTFGYRRSDKEP